MLNDADFAATAAPPADAIAVRGAREHNLRNLDVDIPRGRFVVVTGVSGSGKSTLAFDLLFAEGQRRFLDSMSAYARQFVEQLARPDVDLIAGLPPTVSIEQSTTRGGGKSTVATVTEIYHFIRLLFARLGTQHCPDCGVPVAAQTRDELRAALEAEAKERGELTLLAPVIRNRKGFHSEVADWARQHGYEEIRADGKWYRTDQPFRLDRFKEHDLEVVVGTLAVAAKAKAGTPDARPLVDDALRIGKGVLHALDKRGRQTVHSTDRSCPKCRRSFAPLDPKNFSYNSSQGWCPKCRGFGELFYIPEVERGANADAVEENWWRWAEGKREVCPECHGARLRPEARAVRLAMSKDQFPVTKALGRKPKSGSLGIGHSSFPTITDLATLTVDAALAWAEALRLEGRSAEVARDILPEIRERLRFLREVGLGYLQLGRGVITLSGGEGQRIRLAAQLGSNLSGVLYVLDEPTIGLHNRDNDRLLDCLHKLRDRGNSLVVVEHDEETMRRADYIIDLGPGAGVNGGQVVAAGTVAELLRHPESLTGQMLKALETKTYPTRGERRPVAANVRSRAISPAPDNAVKLPRQSAKKKSARTLTSAATEHGWLTLYHAAKNNLKELTVRFPLGRFIAVTGVSGSGKSTLIKECLFPAVEAALKLKVQSSKFKVQGSDLFVTGFESLHAVHEVDQSPIGRTPRSTPATYVGFFDDIRQLFASATEAKMRGYGPGRFSFNSVQGRCPDCEGKGVIELEMNFLPTAQVKCERCGGRRFNPETLDVQWNGKSIADVLNLSVAEGLEFFAAHRKLLRPLEALHDTGLDYLRLGQTSPTLSGGEAQRIKLVTHLLSGLKSAANAALEVQSSKFKVQSLPKRDLFILEEPTIGLHMQDVRRLVEVLQRLVDAGHTVVVIEHNLDLIAEADWVIDLGPEGGDAGGQIVAQGTPEEVAAVAGSHTGRYLRGLLRLDTFKNSGLKPEPCR